MALSSSGTNAGMMSAGRRVAIGANVALSILVAAALLAAVNWIGSMKYVREDLASLGQYGLSDRTQRILGALQEEVQISTIYPPNEEDKKQQEYIERLQDYCDELQRFSSKMKVTEITADSQREKLVARISSTFGGEATKHKEALDAFEKERQALQADLQQRLAEANSLMAGDAWLGDFPLFANIAATLQADSESLKKAVEEIKEFVPPGGIPKYADATNKAKTTLSEFKEHFQAISQRMTELAILAEETGKPDSAFIQTMGEVAVQPAQLVASLRAIVGQDADSLPNDPAAALKAFADRGVQVSTELEALVRRVDTYARKFPMVKQHPNWAAQVRYGPINARVEVADVLQQAGKTLGETRLVILGIIDGGDLEKLKKALEDTRHDVGVLEKNASVCQQLLSELAQRLAKVDDASKALLDAARSGTLYKERLTAIEALDKQLKELPELKLGGIADQLKEDNLVVVQTASKIRVIEFSEMFRARESVGGPSAAGEDLGRTFNGDGALSSAILAITQEKPVATIVLTSFEPPPPQQRNQFMPPPPESWVPSRSLSQFRQRLEAANFKVVDWNMATAKEVPPVDEGTEGIFVVLPPPPPSPPNPFGGQQPPDQVFGDSQREKIRELLNSDARMIFLATWEVRAGGGGFFGGPPMTPPYGYGPLLEQDWGVKVDNGRRIVWLEPDRSAPNAFNVVPARFGHMPAGGFTDNEIGKPLRGTRFLINDACPIHLNEKLPDGVTASAILSIPRKENYNAVNVRELIDIIDQIRNPTGEGRVTIVPPPEHGPFDVMVAAERREGEKTKGKIVVASFGGSLRDEYLESPVVADPSILRFDPPPTENLDLSLNALYWLSGHPEWIARGPVPVPRVEPIAEGELIALRVFIWGVWPALVFLPGIVLWYIRRR